MSQACEREPHAASISSCDVAWPLDEDGVPHREAARVVLFDATGRILLARGHDAAQPERSWWFTIGGGIEEGEDPRQCAQRELFEETGIRLDVNALKGPVLYRSAEFDFLTVTARQDEWFFIAQLEGKTPTLQAEGWTALEREVIDEQRWWNLDELATCAVDTEVYPRSLVDLAHKWLAGWDGVMEVISESSR